MTRKRSSVSRYNYNFVDKLFQSHLSFFALVSDAALFVNEQYLCVKLCAGNNPRVLHLKTLGSIYASKAFFLF